MREGKYLFGDEKKMGEIFGEGNYFFGGEEEQRRKGWHPEAGRQVKKLGAALARHTGQEEGEAVSHMWSRMGILLQRGNAAILGNRIPNQPGAYIDGIL